MRVSWRTEVPQWIVLAALFVAAAASWRAAPERIPVHWGITGAPDRYGGKVEGLFLPPLLALGIYLGLLFLPRIDPGRANYASFQGAYLVIRLAVLAMAAAVSGIVLLFARGYPVDTSRGVPLVVGLALVVTGNFMGKLRPNWLVGIRTPWTLTSRQSWTKTHRQGGRLLIVVGLLLAAAGALGIPALFVTTFGVLIAGCVWLLVYSYRVWRTDPERTTPAGTSPAPDAAPFA